MEIVSVALIKEEVQLLDPNWDHEDYGFRAAVVLMSAAFVTGPHTQSLAAFTLYPASFVAEISDRMYRAGLWRDGLVESEHWFEGDRLTLGFWIDTLVAEGVLSARMTEDGQREYCKIKPT